VYLLANTWNQIEIIDRTLSTVLSYCNWVMEIVGFIVIEQDAQKFCSSVNDFLPLNI